MKNLVILLAFIFSLSSQAQENLEDKKVKIETIKPNRLKIKFDRKKD